MTTAEILVAFAFAAAFAAAVRHLARHGLCSGCEKGGCGGNCAHCRGRCAVKGIDLFNQPTPNQPNTQMKNHKLPTLALCAASIAAFADDPAAAELENEDGLPEVTLGADYCSRQITRGLPDNTDPILTLSAALGWQGFSVEVDGIFDTTDIAEEDGFDAWDNTEIDTVLGYECTLDTEAVGGVTLGADYTYEYDQGGDGDSDHVSYLHASAGLDDVFLAPKLTGEWMLDGVHGQYYTLELSHGFELAENLELTLTLVEGLANDKYNEDDLGCDSWGFRETTLLAELGWEPAGGLSVTPYLAYGDHLNGHFRHAAHYYADEEASHHVAQLYGGVAVELAF